MGFGIPLIQGGQEQQETTQQLIVAVIVCGLAIVAAQPLVGWITGFSKETVTLANGDERTYWTDEPGEVSDGMTESEILEHAMPSDVTTLFDKIIMGVRGIAGLIMIIAIIWGGVKLQAKADLSREKRG